MCSSSGTLGGKSTYNSVCKESLKHRKKNVKSSVGVGGGGWHQALRTMRKVFFFSSNADVKMHVPAMGEGRRENGWGDPPHGRKVVGLDCSMH